MKITDLELFAVPPRWLFLKITTDAGLSGWGEPIVEGRAETVRAAVEELRGVLVGQDPRRVEDLFQGEGPSGSSGSTIVQPPRELNDPGQFVGRRTAHTPPSFGICPCHPRTVYAIYFCV